MRIGIDIRLIGKKQTGSEATFFNLTKNLALIDSENEYKLFTDIFDGKILSRIKKELGLENRDNFEIISLPASNKFDWNFWTLPKYLRKKPVDVYLTQYITPWFVPRRIKIITIVHDISFNFFPQFIRLVDLIFLKTLIPLSLRRADKIIGVSRFTKNEIIKYYKIDPAKVDYIHNAVSDNFFQISEGRKEVTDAEIAAVKKKYALPEKFILYIGTLQPRKNLPILIEAFMLLREAAAGTLKLVIAGGQSHNYDTRIAKTVEKNKLSADVFFPGFIDEDDKAILLAAAKVFCFPSLYEGFGIPILESMSVGTPVIASDIPPHREIAGDAALFFNPALAGEAAEKYLEITLSDISRNNFTIKGHLQVRKFSWQKTAEKMLSIFENLG